MNFDLTIFLYRAPREFNHVSDVVGRKKVDDLIERGKANLLKYTNTYIADLHCCGTSYASKRR